MRRLDDRAVCFDGGFDATLDAIDRFVPPSERIPGVP
jgi:hypothetical protein